MSEIQARKGMVVGEARAEAELGRWVNIGLMVLVLTFGVTIAWSTLAPIASAVVGSGQVKVDTSRKKIQHLEGGVIRAILVRDGDHVSAGQSLVRLDETRAGASHDVLQAQYGASIAQQARLEAERDGAAEIIWPEELLMRRTEPKVAEILAAQQSQFDARRASLEGELQILDKQIASKRSEISGLIGQQRSKESQLESFRAELAGLGDLMARGMVERTRVRNLEREIARLEGERAEHVSEVAAAGALIGERELQKFQARKSFHEGVVAELRQVQAEGFDYLERMGAARYVLEQTELKSPVDGTVVEMRAHTQGGVVGPGELLMEIVPSNDRLIIEAKVRPEDIDRVRLGLPAGIKLLAFEQRTLAELNGTVTYLSADAIEDERAGLVYFLMKVEVPEGELARLDGQTVQPGMLAEVFVRTGERTFLSYLLKPLADSFDRAWRER